MARQKATKGKKHCLLKKILQATRGSNSVKEQVEKDMLKEFMEERAAKNGQKTVGTQTQTNTMTVGVQTHPEQVPPGLPEPLPGFPGFTRFQEFPNPPGLPPVLD